MSEAGAVTVAGGGGGLPASARGGLPGGLALPSMGDLRRLSARPDILLAVAVMGILAVLMVPLPPIVLDLLLAISIIVSVLILMTALFIENPMEFSVFPTVLLIATMLRLSLNLATTRLILAHGHESGAPAGHVIEAFGHFVMGGNFVIGVIVFVILILVNFIVITKGSGRIAEVAARFTLDAMPGKQMAIDADLSAGLIDQEGARERRRALEDESAFYGAMDGASKFVRGDAIAALLITVINVIGGIIIGVAQQGLSFGEASRSYTLLTVGDGIVSQVPALIVSTAAGLLVSKAGVRGAAAGALGKQLASYPRALGMSAAVMAGIGLLPGIPILPFALLAGAAGWFALKFEKENKAKAAKPAAAAAAAAAAGPVDEPMADVLKIDDVKIEIGYGLLPMVNGGKSEDRLTDQIKALRRQLAGELGFVMPSVRILDNVLLDANSYIIRVKEVEAGQGRVYPGLSMAMDPMGGQVQLPGQHMLEPTFGLPATWIDAALVDEAGIRGYTVVDAATVLSTHLTEVIKGHTAELLSHIEVQKLLKELPEGARRPRARDHPVADLDDRPPARAAAPPRRAHLHPRPRHDPGRGRRRGGGGEEPPRHRRARPHAARPPDLRAIHDADRTPADRDAVARLGIGVPGFDRRPGRRAPPRHAAVAAERLRDPGPRALRGGGPDGRDAGARDLQRRPPVRAVDHREVPPRDAGDRPGRDPCTRAPEDRRQHLAGGSLFRLPGPEPAWHEPGSRCVPSL